MCKFEEALKELKEGKTMPCRVLTVLIENREAIKNDSYLTVNQIDKLMLAGLPPEFDFAVRSNSKKIYNSMFHVRALADKYGFTIIQRIKPKSQKQVWQYKIATDDVRDKSGVIATLIRQEKRRVNTNDRVDKRKKIAVGQGYLEQGEVDKLLLK